MHLRRPTLPKMWHSKQLVLCARRRSPFVAEPFLGKVLNMNRIRYLICSIMFCFSAPANAQTETKIRLTDVSKNSGIVFIHSDGGTGKRYVVESVVGGLATLDYDNDGLQDIFFVNGMSLDNSSPQPTSTNSLYRNNGDFTFTDVTRQAGLSRRGYGMGAVAADYDNDGDIDLYVSNFGKNFFYLNNGDGSFAEVTESIGLILPELVGAGCSFLDIEQDGDLDLYVGSYVQFSLDKHKQRTIGKHLFHPGPTDYPPNSDALFLNQGDGSFINISQSSGINVHASYTMGVVAFDVDGDNDIDLLAGNDQRPNSLWINDGTGKFSDQAIVSGIAFDRLGRANGNMGVEIGDINSDGLLDVFTTTYQDEMPVMYVNLGAGQFADQTNILRIDNRLKPHVTWGCGLVDFDNDGDLEIYVACGHFMDNIRFIDDRTDVKVRDFVLENRNGKFVDVSAQVGSGLTIVESSRGAAFEDFNNDGTIDAVILNANAAPSLLKNESNANPPGSRLQLIGVQSNRGGVGAKITVVGKTKKQTFQLVAGRGYESQYGSSQHVGIGDERPQSIEILWPSGRRESFPWPVDKTVQIVEGTGQLLP
jgi:enediyne biosynthesis protein E4